MPSFFILYYWACDSTSAWNASIKKSCKKELKAIREQIRGKAGVQKSTVPASCLPDKALSF